MKWPPDHLPRGFPLTVAERGYVVSVAGKTRWVCGKKSPKEALAVYARKLSSWQDDEPALPIVEQSPESPTVHWLLNRWLLDRRGDAQRGQLRGGTFQDYKRSAKRIDRIIGTYYTDDITPDHVKALYDKLHRTHGEDAARRIIAHLRACAREAEDRGWCRPIRIGAKMVAKLTARTAPRMKWRLYTPAEVRKILLACNRRIRSARGDSYRFPWQQMKAMILLALNGGYGARELSELPRAVVDLEGRRIDYARGKTSMEHVVPLWPESCRALRVVLRQRPDDLLVFRTRSGNPWTREEKTFTAGKLVRTVNHDNVAWAFNELVRPLGLKFNRQSFYRLRHLFATTADRAQDTNAVALLMGHSLGIKGHYIRVDESRLREVVEFVRHQLLFRGSKSISTG